MNPVQVPRTRVLVAAIVSLAAIAGAGLYLSRGTCPSARRVPAVSVPVAQRSGYTPMTIHEVTRAGGGYAVTLVNATRERDLVIYIGQTEGMTLNQRIDGERSQRPLTADLLDSVMARLGGKLHHVQVDDLRLNVFHGSLHVDQNGQRLEIDARPSDAMALAIGAGKPILVSERVLDEAGQPHR
jgi:bifunctional DNase/RNase